MAKYLPVEASEIEAVQLTNNFDSVYEILALWVKDWPLARLGVDKVGNIGGDAIEISVYDQFITVKVGDYVVRDYDGTVRVISKEEFEDKYIKAPKPEIKVKPQPGTMPYPYQPGTVPPPMVTWNVSNTSGGGD